MAFNFASLAGGVPGINTGGGGLTGGSGGPSNAKATTGPVTVGGLEFSGQSKVPMNWQTVAVVGFLTLLGLGIASRVK